jgi:hypothetical protein
MGGDEARDLAVDLGDDRPRLRIGGEALKPRGHRLVRRRVTELVEQRGDRGGVGRCGVADDQSAVVTGPLRSRSRS